MRNIGTHPLIFLLLFQGERLEFDLKLDLEKWFEIDRFELEFSP